MIAAIENAMLARLHAASDADVLGYRYRSLETYPANWDEYFANKTDWKAPAAWAVFGGGNALRFTPSGRVRFDNAAFGLVVAAENLRNEQAQRHGGPAGSTEPGSYQLMLDALALLSGSALGLDIDALRPVRALSVRPFGALKERNVSMWVIEFTSGFEIDALAGGGEALDDFTTLHLDWDVPAFGTVVPPLPAVAADARDTLTFPPQEENP